ncbi:hypothetical protein M501DRAFT_948964 [Patellaria atrata CBS 101060]|uniref:Zn(2)-C6 fungal-type domain-containing protein n=1 Tax=Patellaria atrata CBS 101060 TaxID=1346257 RepID=A0A9P4VUY1_9PEZI|nr:hypothetical protein M501DRAFT_948964 [Patellaria atrata CBS 101060]
MGRKPNQFILEYFERGPKLEDNSNRYQHTCKNCAEKFPKGRIDSLINHLVKNCPALPVRDRQRAILQFHHLPDLPADPTTPPNMTAVTQANFQNMPNSHNLPFTPKQGMSALETLAEVSRQQLDLSGKRTRKSGKRQASQDTSTQNNAILEEFLVQDDRPFEDGVRPDWAASSSTEALPAFPNSQYQANSPHSSPQISNLPLSSSSAPTAQMLHTPLMMAATAANELQQSMMPNSSITMEHDGLPPNNMSDKYFHAAGKMASWGNMQIDPMLQGPNQDQEQRGSDHQEQHNSTHTDSLENRAASFPRPIAINPNSPQTQFINDFSLNQKPKAKVRGRFTDTRRKEVQEVRKRGACIRCRMLKKPCSGDNPCHTCQSVESARLWKQPCIRTRIAEEFNMYSSGLHSVLAFHATTHAKSQAQFQPSHGRMEATQFPKSCIYATFMYLKGQRESTDLIDPSLSETGDSSFSLGMLDTDKDDVGGKLENYIKRLAFPAYFESEPSTLMKPTLMQAYQMSLLYPSNETLVGRVLDLWITTQILTDSSIPWDFFYNSSDITTSTTPTSLPPLEELLRSPERTVITPSSHPATYNLILAQLLAATEKRAASLSKYVMNELERRLLQRQQSNRFEIFIIAIILLACMERMAWLYQSWEPSNPSQRRTWPLDKRPAEYANLGERFADILNMLLKMRNVPPKMAESHDDSGVLVLTVLDETDSAAKAWFESVRLTKEEVKARSERSFEEGDCRCLEGRFVGRVLGV